MKYWTIRVVANGFVIHCGEDNHPNLKTLEDEDHVFDSVESALRFLAKEMGDALTERRGYKVAEKLKI
jgi:hypothetical protein